TWQVVSNSGAVPANSIYAYGVCQLITPGSAEFDDLLAVRVRSLIDEVQMKGSVPLMITNPGFAYIPISGALAWFWDGSSGSSILTIFRSDGTSFQPNPDNAGF